MSSNHGTGVSTTFYRPINSNNNEIMKDIISKHKVLLSLSDNKVKLENIKAILHNHNIPIPTNFKLADLKDLLLQHCNTTTTMPITFLSDSSIETYTEAKEREHSSKQEQVTCVPITFIDDAMVNLVKTQENTDEMKTFKRIDLTPNKQGYTPERHPTKKQKVGKTELNYDKDDIDNVKTGESFVIKESKSKSFKEMIKSMTTSCDSSESDDDDFNKAFQPLIIDSNMFFVTLDEPTESEKQAMQVKSYISDSFDYSHEFQMVKTQDLWEYREFDRSLTPKTGNNHHHLEQVRRFILKNGFQEPIIISHDLKTGKAYITEGNHRLWVYLKEGIPFIPCRVIPHWLSPNGSYKKLDIDVSTLKPGETILPEQLGLTVAKTGFN